MAADEIVVLFADPDPSLAAPLTVALAPEGIEVKHVADGASLLLALQKYAVDVVVADSALPGQPGLKLLATAGERWPDLPIILTADEADVTHAVEAVKAGAADFIAKPLDPSEVAFLVRKTAAAAEQADDAPPPSTVVGRGTAIIGQAQVMRDVFQMVQRAANSTATVLVRGESGTGKELIARRVHELSPRAKGPFIKVHCAALPEQLLESELFGYEKGAFTGAASRKPGRVELAENGTLFLDEIGDISPATQVKLLRVLQDREFERLGGTETIKARVRFVAATHRNLEKMVKDGEFREDLYYRLNVIPITVPPLRDRPEDIEALVNHFCLAVSAANGKRTVTIDDAGTKMIRAAPWPGNVRQLQNFVERLVVLSEDDQIPPGVVQRELHQHHHSQPMSSAASGPTSMSSGYGELTLGASVIELDAAVRKAEKRALEKALRKASGNRTLAARILGVSRRTLYNKLAEHGLS